MGSISEKFDSRDFKWDGEQSTGTYRYLLWGFEEDEEGAYDLLVATRPDNWIIGSIELLPKSPSINPIGAGIFDGEVEYTYFGPKEPREDGDTSVGSLQGGTGGGSIHLNYSLSTVQAYSASGYSAATTDNKNAIAVETGGGAMEVKGTDIPARLFRFTTKKLVSDGSVTPAYFSALYAMTTCVNSAAYRPHPKMPNFAAGELLLEDFRFDQQDDATWEFTFYWSASPNVTDLAIGDISGIAKKGWEFLWLSYIEKVQSDQRVKRPVRAYVEQVFYTANFSAI